MLFILAAFVLLVLSVVPFALYVQITPMPSSQKAKKAIHSLVPHDASTIYELGSGWGGVACDLARYFPQVEAFELSPLPWMVSLLLKKIKGRSNLVIKRKNFLKSGLQGADCIVCYLAPQIMQKLKPKFENELKSGCCIISNSFAIPGWTPIKTIKVNDLWKSEIFLYKSCLEDPLIN